MGTPRGSTCMPRSGGFREGWIPDNYYGEVVVPRIKGDYGDVAKLKPLARRLFATDAIPDIASFVNGWFFSADGEVVDPHAIEDFLFDRSPRIVFKVDASLQGQGVFLLDRSRFSLDTIRDLGNGVSQEYVQQHEAFARLMPSSVATLRLTTTIDEGSGATLRAAYLRLGRAADSHVMSRSHVRIPVDRRTGALVSPGFLADWGSIKEHPDTKERFRGGEIPSFEECGRLVMDLHQRVPFARCVGWDVTVDQDGNPKVLEWNGGHNDIKFSEATQGPCFADLGWERFWRNDEAGGT